jgi:hypothetical protein
LFYAVRVPTDLKAAEKLRRSRYTAVTVPAAPSNRSAMTAKDAETELARARQTDLTARALPHLIPPREPPASWARPVRRPEPGTGDGKDANRADAPVVPAPSAPASEALHTDKDTKPMTATGRLGRLPSEREDHYMRLAGAQVVSTRALMAVRENIRAAIDAKAMICIYQAVHDLAVDAARHAGLPVAHISFKSTLAAARRSVGTALPPAETGRQAP